MNEQVHSTMEISTDSTRVPVEIKSPSEPMVQRWRSSLFSPSIRTDRPCDWRCHVRHSAARVLGFLMCLAARDPERFCWAGWEAMSDNASKLGERPIGRSQVFAILALFERNRILERATALRRSAKRRGFIVHPHEAWTFEVAELGVCGLLSDADKLRAYAAQSIESRRRRQQLMALSAAGN
jgi:hypothetical protein